MKKKFVFWGMMVMVLTFELTVVGCSFITPSMVSERAEEVKLLDAWIGLGNNNQNPMEFNFFGNEFIIRTADSSKVVNLYKGTFALLKLNSKSQQWDIIDLYLNEEFKDGKWVKRKSVIMKAAFATKNDMLIFRAIKPFDKLYSGNYFNRTFLEGLNEGDEGYESGKILLGFFPKQ